MLQRTRLPRHAGHAVILRATWQLARLRSRRCSTRRLSRRSTARRSGSLRSASLYTTNPRAVPAALLSLRCAVIFSRATSLTMPMLPQAQKVLGDVLGQRDSTRRSSLDDTVWPHLPQRSSFDHTDARRMRVAAAFSRRRGF